MSDLMSKAEFDKRVTALTKKYEFLRKGGSDITKVWPGWLSALESLLDEIGAIAMSNQFTFFFVGDEDSLLSTQPIYWESTLRSEQGRALAIAEAIKNVRRKMNSTCRYCSCTTEASTICPEHRDVIAGRYADDVEFIAYRIPEMIDEIDVCLNALSVHRTAGTDLEAPVRAILQHLWYLNNSEGVTEDNYLSSQAIMMDAIKKVDDAKKEEPCHVVNENEPVMQLFEPSEFENVVKITQSRERKQVLEPYFKALRDLGPHRQCALIPETWRRDLDLLALDFPNFVEVIKFVKQQFALAERGDRRLYFPPILLNGPSGIGKTYLAQQLARIVKTSYAEIHMEAEQNSSALSGSSAFWSNAMPGKIAEVLCLNNLSNPVVVVDELDKTARDTRYDPLAGLYSLLEPNTAKRFEDLCLQVPLNASGICWVMTSNEHAGIPLPIMSRLRLFEVPTPTREEVITISRRIYRDLLVLHPWGVGFDDELPEEVAAELCEREPRVIRNTLLGALGNAALANRRELMVEDLVFDWGGVAQKSRRIGF